MAPPKKIIALTPLELNQYQICLFRREGKKKWHIVKILIENAPKSKIEAIEKMKLISEQLKIPWQKKPLKDVTRKRLHNVEKRKARKQAQLTARAKKPAILTFDGTSLGRPGISASAAVIEMPDFIYHTNAKFLACAYADDAEYEGLIIGLEKAQKLGISKLEIKGDSKMVIYQILGKYPIKPNSKFLDYRERVLNLLSCLDDYSLCWIPRKQNQLADKAAKKCLKEHQPTYSKSLAEEYVEYLIYGNCEDYF
ncbi:MAG: ribonuclease HI family protein [Cyanobacteria bacterium J06635_10]